MSGPATAVDTRVRSPGVAALPFDVPIVVEATVEIAT
jgi:hypothetical protein